MKVTRLVQTFPTFGHAHLTVHPASLGPQSDRDQPLRGGTGRIRLLSVKRTGPGWAELRLVLGTPSVGHGCPDGLPLGAFLDGSKDSLNLQSVGK